MTVPSHSSTPFESGVTTRVGTPEPNEREMATLGKLRLPSTGTSSTATLTASTEADAEAGLQSSQSEPVKEEAPYHIYSRKRKWVLVYIISIAGMFSPLSSNIYFPAIDTISSDLHVNASLVALTVTVYMVVQGIAPSFWAPWSDARGRRVVLACMLGVYAAANLALAFTKNYAMLLALRGIQAAGSAATISIGTGVIADIALPSERGGFVGTNSGIRMMGQALGPVIGGIFNGIWGFRSIFWLLLVLSLLVLLMLLTFLPETHRGIAGNGSIPLKGIHKPFIYLVRPTPAEWLRPATETKKKLPPLSFKSVFTPLKHLFEKDVACLLAWGALIYTIWSMVTSSTSTVLLAEFPTITPLQLGLSFLPNGVGCVLGSVLTGKLLDRNFRRTAALYRKEHGLPDDAPVRKGDPAFPYEKARLPPVPYLSASMIATVALYGASYELNDLQRFAVANLLVSLALQFFIGFAATAVFSINSAMLVDCFPDGAAGAAAVNNLARCSLGALGVAVIEPMIEGIKIRNAFLVLAGIAIAFSPLVWVEAKYGEGWRRDREARKEAEAVMERARERSV